ncbi:hypothetical protein CISIN_1g0107601mg, partial [Citrus sinensis]
GPVFAIIGAWLIYQFQNKDLIAKDVSERMFQKAILSTALSFIISNFGPVDTWAHLGAAFTDLGGNTSTWFLLTFALTTGAIGVCSVTAGLMHLRAWRSESLAAASSLAILSWSVTAIAVGFVCKEIILGGHRGKRLQTLEAFAVISLLSQLLYLGLVHAWFFY